MMIFLTCDIWLNKSILVAIFIEYTFQPFTFSPCVSLKLAWFSSRQHVVVSYSFIHSITLCFLFGKFNSTYLLIAKYLLLSFVNCYLFCSSFVPFFHLVFHCDGVFCCCCSYCFVMVCFHSFLLVFYLLQAFIYIYREAYVKQLIIMPLFF